MAEYSTALIPLATPFVQNGSSYSLGAGLKNLNVVKSDNGRVYVEQRPGLGHNAGYNPSGSGGVTGRFLGQTLTRMAQVWDRTVWVQDGSNIFTNRGTMSGAVDGAAPGVYGLSSGSHLYLIACSSSTTVNLYRVSDSGSLDDIDNATYPNSAGFPTKGGEVLAGGFVYLDGYASCLTLSGSVYTSGLGDLTSWNALDFIDVEGISGGVYIGTHKGHLAVLGSSGIRFLYFTSRPTGSPYEIRRDVNIETRVIGGCAQWGDNVFFSAVDPHGQPYFGMLDGFQERRISTMDIERLIRANAGEINFTCATTSSALSSGVVKSAGCVEIGSQVYYVVSFESNDGSATILTMAYNVETGAWSRWTKGAGDSPMYFIGQSRSVAGGGQPGTNTIHTMQVDYMYTMQPSLTRDEVSDNSFSVINTEVITPEWFGEPHETGRRKSIRSARVICDHSTDASDTYTLSWTTDQYSTYQSHGSFERRLERSVRQPGVCYRAAFKLTRGYNAPFRAESIYLEYEVE